MSVITAKHQAAPGRASRRLWQSVGLNLLTLLGIASLMALVAYLAVTVFFPNSLRLDEAQSLYQTNRTIDGTLKLVAQDVHVPLYHVILHYWLAYFGNTIEAGRTLSLIFFMASIPMTFYLGTYAFKRRSVGFFAAVLVALSPFMNWYGSEIRMYTQLTFVTLVNQLFFLKIYREAKPGHWVGYVLSAILGIYTHYFFAFILLTEAIFYLLKRRSFAARRALLKFALSAVVVLAAFAPWFYYFVKEGLASNTQPALAPPSSVDLFNTYSQFIFGFQADWLNTIIVSSWPIVVLLAFFALQKSKKTSDEVVFFVLMATVPVLVAFILSLAIKPFYLSRYLIAALPALFIYISWIFSTYPPKLANTFRGLLLAGVIAGMAVQILNPATPVKEDYAAATAYVSSRAKSSDVVAVSAPFSVYPIEYYYTGPAKLTTIPYWNRFQTGAIPTLTKATLASEVNKANGAYQTVWLVLSQDQGYERMLYDYYESHYQRIDQRQFSAKLNVYAYKLRYDDPVMVSSATP